MKAVFSKSYEAKRSRIRRIPKFTKSMMDAATKMDAAKAIKIFQDGISHNSFGLEPLKPESIARNIRAGLPKPSAPLYGRGVNEKNSYVNMFRIVRLKRGWRVRPRSAKHWSGRVKLAVLFHVHENGATIDNGKAIIKIPSRNAWEKAQKRFLNKKISAESAYEVKKALKRYMKTGSQAPVRAFLKKADKESSKYEKRN